MRYIKDFQEELSIFRALGSEVRISILELLMKNGRMSMNEIATSLNLSNGALTPHIRKLEESDRYDQSGAGHRCERQEAQRLDRVLRRYVLSRQAGDASPGKYGAL